MNPTRTGKIARLSKGDRDRIGIRLEDGVPGKQIVAWLNDLPWVQRTLASEFDGHPITQQNLSEWKAGGHQDWLREQQSVRLVKQLTEHAMDLDDAATDLALSDRLASVLSVQLTRVALALVEQETDNEKRWERLCQVNRELARLRREDHCALHLQLEHDRMDIRHREREQEKDQKRHARRSDSFLDSLARLDPRRPGPEEDEEESEPRPWPPERPVSGAAPSDCPPSHSSPGGPGGSPDQRPNPARKSARAGGQSPRSEQKPRPQEPKGKPARPPKKPAPSDPIKPNPTQSDLSDTPDHPRPAGTSPHAEGESAAHRPAVAESPQSAEATCRLVDNTIPPARPLSSSTQPDGG